MKRFLITSAVLLSTLASASADQVRFHWYDTIRPHGHARSDAIFDNAVNSCNQSAGEQDVSVSPAFKACMHGFGYRYMYSRLERTPAPKRDRSVVTYNRDSPIPMSDGTMRAMDSAYVRRIATIPKFPVRVSRAETLRSWEWR